MAGSKVHDTDADGRWRQPRVQMIRALRSSGFCRYSYVAKGKSLGMWPRWFRTPNVMDAEEIATLEKFGMWLHLAVVLDASAPRVVHYVNGVPISEKNLKMAPPFRISAAELGNGNAKGFPENDPFMIRNFSGAMDEFCLFNRALHTEEIRTLYAPRVNLKATHSRRANWISDQRSIT